MTKEERELFLFWLIRNGGTVWDGEMQSIYRKAKPSKIRFKEQMREAGWVNGDIMSLTMTDKCKRELQNDGTNT